MKTLALALVTALAFSAASTAKASDWLFFDQEEDVAIQFADDLPYTFFTPLPGPNSFDFAVDGPVTYTHNGVTHLDGYLESSYFGGDTWIINYGADEEERSSLDGYFFAPDGPKAGFYTFNDFYPVPGDPRTYVGYHSTELTTCDTASPGCSVQAILAAPEPSSWALMFGGIGLLGGVLRLARTRGRRDANISLHTA